MEKNTLDNGWIQTFTGKRFQPLAPVVSDICIEDIAWSLANQCRYNGHSRHYYSVAQHSVIVSQLVEQTHDLPKWGLLHDASEAYLHDLPAPLKRLPEFQFYKDAEAQLMLAICRRFEIYAVEPPEVKAIDRALLVTEAEQLMSPLHPDWVFKRPEYEGVDIVIEPLSPSESAELFMSRFYELFKV